MKTLMYKNKPIQALCVYHGIFNKIHPSLTLQKKSGSSELSVSGKIHEVQVCCLMCLPDCIYRLFVPRNEQKVTIIIEH